MRTHIVPTIGKHRLADLEPEHVEYLYTALLAKGLKVGTVHHVRTTLNKALNDAVRRRRIPRNPLALANTPRYDAPEIEPLTVAEARTLVAAAHDEPNGVACILAISLGLRRGEVIDPRDHSLHWTAFLEGAGVRPARLHDARHTAATLLLVQGVDQRVVMDMLGWTSPTMTARYQHVVPELVEEANRRISELLRGHGKNSTR